MSNIKQGSATNVEVVFPTALTGLAAGGVSVSNEIDNSLGYLSDDIQIIGTLAGTSDGNVDVYYMGANETGLYPSGNVIGNLTTLMSMNVTDSLPNRSRRIEQLPSFYKIVVINSDSTLALGITNLYHKLKDLTNV